jgi:hypothetical protein
MMKIVLLMKEYIGLHISTKKNCSHILQTYHVQIPPVKEDNKQQTNYQKSFMTRYLFFQKWFFKETSLYTTRIIPYVE